VKQKELLMDSVTVEVFTSIQVQRAAGLSFTKTRNSSSSIRLNPKSTIRSSLTAYVPDDSEEPQVGSFEHLTNLVQESISKSAIPCFDEDTYRGIVASRDDLIGKCIIITNTDVFKSSTESLPLINL
jgi:hypothetical protein